jgi:hypothetical protein
MGGSSAIVGSTAAAEIGVRVFLIFAARDAPGLTPDGHASSVLTSTRDLRCLRHNRLQAWRPLHRGSTIGGMERAKRMAELEQRIRENAAWRKVWCTLQSFANTTEFHRRGEEMRRDEQELDQLKERTT